MGQGGGVWVDGHPDVYEYVYMCVMTKYNLKLEFR